MFFHRTREWTLRAQINPRFDPDGSQNSDVMFWGGQTSCLDTVKSAQQLNPYSHQCPYCPRKKLVHAALSVSPCLSAVDLWPFRRSCSFFCLFFFGANHRQIQGQEGPCWEEKMSLTETSLIWRRSVCIYLFIYLFVELFPQSKCDPAVSLEAVPGVWHQTL